MDALENTGKKPGSFYKDCTIYTTLSLCPMCSDAILLYGISKVVIGENMNFLGSEELLRFKGVNVEVINAPECIELMWKFIKENPALWFEDIGE